MPFNTFKTGDAHRLSLPTANKYIRRSVKKKHTNKNRDTKPRPKPLQIENEKYYDHIFPAQHPKQETKTSTSTYYQPNSLDHAEL